MISIHVDVTSPSCGIHPVMHSVVVAFMLLAIGKVFKTVDSGRWQSFVLDITMPR